jgi:hypothetical protein
VASIFLDPDAFMAVLGILLQNNSPNPMPHGISPRRTHGGGSLLRSVRLLPSIFRSRSIQSKGHNRIQGHYFLLELKAKGRGLALISISFEKAAKQGRCLLGA